MAAGEDGVDGALAQVGGHGAWDKEQSMQVSHHPSCIASFGILSSGQQERTCVETNSE